MIVRLRLRAGVYISALVLLAGLALTAHATQAVTQSQMQSYVLGVIGAAGVVVFGAFWILLVTISGRSERALIAQHKASADALIASVERLEAAVTDFTYKLETHDGSPFAHRAASEHNHGPLEAKIDKVEAQIEQVEKTVETFLQFCRTHQCAIGSRDPADSPKPKRAGDSGDDYRPLRGKQ